MSDAKDLTTALGGKWYRTYGAAPCPVCQPQRDKGQTALTLADGHSGRLVLNCKKSACDFVDILAAAGLRRGDYIPPDAATLAQRDEKQKFEAQKRALQAKQVWTEALPISGTLAEAYLRGRGITCNLGKVLRFHPRCWHGPTSKRYPALVAAVQGTRLPAVHRTYLCAHGGSKADIDQPKLMLGAVAGGAVQLTEGSGPLVVAEGIETGLSLASGLLRKPATVLAALSTSGIRGLRLPDQPGRLTIAPDGDTAGREAANALAAKAYALGWQVSLLPAPNGCDWNDVLTLKGEAA